jgi:uncharacterized protein YndB with AHSA1/START domain
MEGFMLKIVGIIAAVFVVSVVVVLVYAATKPDTFRIQRTASIKAPPEKIFATLNDFQTWGTWSPWETKDPAMKRTFSGAEKGRGAVYEWDGDRNVGKGRMEITESSPPSKVALDLNMIKPFEAKNTVEFTLEPQGDATRVTWAMNGRTPYIAKIVHVFFDMDRMVGSDFETGLANLKTVAERS